jgi:DNA ligase (NAD+)
MEGLGAKHVEHLYHHGLVKKPADLYALTIQDVCSLPGWGKVSATKTIATIQDKRRVSLDRWIYALGIPLVGQKNAHTFAAYFQSLDEWLEVMNSVSRDDEYGKLAAERLFAELTALDGIGAECAEECLDFMRRNGDWVADFASCVVIQNPDIRTQATDSWLSGRNIVFTGTLPGMTRAEAKYIAESRGGHVLNTLTKTVDCLVMGEASGQKKTAAEKWGIPVITADQWHQWVMDQTPPFEWKETKKEGEEEQQEGQDADNP